MKARREHRHPLDLYHTALEITVPTGRFVIENAWPIPNRYRQHAESRSKGPVWVRALDAFRLFRYEVRRGRLDKALDWPESLETGVSARPPNRR